MKILNFAKTAILSSALSVSCSGEKIASKLIETIPDAKVMQVLDSLSTQSKAMLNSNYKMYGRDTVWINPDFFKNPELITKKLSNIATVKNPKKTNKRFLGDKNHNLIDELNGKLFKKTHAVINSNKVYTDKNGDNIYIPVEFYGKK